MLSPPPSTPVVVPARRRIVRWLAFAAGWLFVALGVIGLLLPVMPTTPFLLLALWAFSLSSQRFHDWLYRHPRFGRSLQLWHAHRVIPWRVKLLAYGGVSVSLGYAALFSAAPGWALAAMAAVMLAGVGFVASCPSKPPPSDQGHPGA